MKWTQFGIQRGGTGPLKQTIEAGWQHYRWKYGDDLPHFFVYFTTDNYNSNANYKGGYNRDVRGWQQVSSTLFPGAALTPGTELYLRVRYWNNNWWIFAKDHWIGYYPASLLATTGLRNYADQVKWFGEITDYKDGATTYTAMGNAFFAGPGAAYARNLRTETTTSMVNYNAQYTKATKPGCYSVASHYNSGGNWQSYFYFGGPGKFAPTCF